MTSPHGPALDDLAVGLAEELGEVTKTVDGDMTSYERGGSAFARASAAVLEVRLPADIGEAALQTPDTTTIPGERGWIRFTPATAERHVIDRAQAWLHTAWRHAGQK